MWYFAYGSNLNVRAVTDWCRHYGHRPPAMKGGKSGPSKNLLIDKIVTGQMPPGKVKLTDKEVDQVRAVLPEVREVRHKGKWALIVV